MSTVTSCVHMSKHGRDLPNNCLDMCTVRQEPGLHDCAVLACYYSMVPTRAGNACRCGDGRFAVHS